MQGNEKFIERPQGGIGGLMGAGNVEKIRDIIFGSQMRDYEKRFTRLEELMVKEIKSLRDEAKKSTDALENYFKQEVESLISRLKTEQSNRNESVSRLSDEIKNTVRSLDNNIGRLDEKLSNSSRDLNHKITDQSKSLSNSLDTKISQLDEKFSKILREVRHEIMEQSKNLSNEIGQKFKESSDALDHTAQELRMEKMDRSMLSEFFIEMGMRMMNESALAINLESLSNEKTDENERIKLKDNTMLTNETTDKNIKNDQNAAKPNEKLKKDLKND
ncbi:hypothetical protein GMMP15_1030039 [Candidatus Magnetomoraceae bacterium gMMP-15]